ncbi:MAG: lipoyl(octanoyl) transferase LipB [Ghiorsea sp.]|nr:lipoyl(octanoyl) transferase LipB [Ghiorsea sp.]
MAAFKYIHHIQQTYPQAMAEQESLRDGLLAGKQLFHLILTEHPPIYTLGTSGVEQDVLTREVDGDTIEVYQTGRGGEVTYHGPGQLMCYIVANLSNEQDLHQHIWRLEEVIIRTLSDLGVEATRDKRGIGVWVNGLKIAAAGVRCRRWVVWHGIALNINPNLNHFKGIVPCGMRDAPVTALNQLGMQKTREEVEALVVKHTQSVFAGLLNMNP